MPVESAPPPEAGEPAEMSVRSMVILGAAMSVGVALVLGVTLLVGGATPTRRGQPVGAAAGAVPPVAGLTASRATAALAKRELPVGAIIQVASSLPAGQVVRTAPPIGSPVAPRTAITLYLSGGTNDTAASAKVAVPYFIGIDGDRAQAVAGQLGLRLEPSGTGRITAQNPAPGTEVARGASVQVTLQ